jgi:glucose/arabinose dehydrogenase
LTHKLFIVAQRSETLNRWNQLHHPVVLQRVGTCYVKTMRKVEIIGSVLTLTALSAAGFTVQLYATGVKNPRGIRTSPNGDLFVAESDANQILVFQGTSGGKPQTSGVFVTGLEQPFGMAFYPPSPNPQWLYVGNTGTARFYIGGNQDPRHAGKHPELKSKVIAPDVLLQPHNASLELTFYEGNQFPGDVWGRPVGVAVAMGGSPMVTDDGSKSIWRVSYGSK